MKDNATLIRDLKKERRELKVKIKKLARFKNSKAWYKIGAKQQTLLAYQFDVMCCYHNILTERIESTKGGTHE